VSTAEQTIERQLAHSRATGFAIDEVVADNGVSGLSTRLVERPEGRRLFDKLRTGCPLGRSPWAQLRGRVRRDPGIHAPGRRDPHHHQQFHVRWGHQRPNAKGRPRRANSLHVRDGPRAQAEATKAAQRAGIEHAKANDGRAYHGREPSYTREQFEQAREMLGRQTVGITQIA
jgi:putative DNA-invertase from lambdoid prophage Rac